MLCRTKYGESSSQKFVFRLSVSTEPSSHGSFLTGWRSHAAAVTRPPPRSATAAPAAPAKGDPKYLDDSPARFSPALPFSSSARHCSLTRSRYSAYVTASCRPPIPLARCTNTSPATPSTTPPPGIIGFPAARGHRASSLPLRSRRRRPP